MANQTAIMKRLKNDFKGLQKEPVVDAIAHPRDDDMTLWEGAINFIAPGLSVVPLHFLISFPKDYPTAAPSVGFSTNWGYDDGASYTVSEGPLKGKYAICLNILGNFAHVHTEWKDQAGTGWSAAYTVGALLVNLQSVLLTKISRGSKSELAKIHSELVLYKANNYVPEIEVSKPAASSATPVDPIPESIPTEIRVKCASFIASLTDEAKKQEFLSILDSLSKLNLAISAGEAGGPVIDKDIFCWHSTSNYTEDVLGYGITVEEKGKKKTIFTDGDYISYTSYKGGLRQYPTNEKFQFFLPVWINIDHSSKQKKWLDAMDESIRDIGKYLGCVSKSSAILTIFPDLINTMIVKMMDKQSDVNASLKIFECIINTWRCFYYFLRTNPDSLKTAVDSANAFINDDSNRRKDKTPNLGWTLAIVSALHRDEVDFGKFIKAYEEESFLRKIFWWKKDKVPLNSARTFEAAEISRNISLFQFTFITRVIGSNIGEIVKQMEETNCRLPSKLEDFLKQWKGVIARMTATPNWAQFFDELVSMGYPEESKAKICSNFDSYLKAACDKAETLEGYFPVDNAWAGRHGAGGRGAAHYGAPQQHYGGRGGGRGGYAGGGRGGGGGGLYVPPGEGFRR